MYPDSSSGLHFRVQEVNVFSGVQAVYVFRQFKQEVRICIRKSFDLHFGVQAVHGPKQFGHFKISTCAETLSTYVAKAVHVSGNVRPTFCLPGSSCTQRVVQSPNIQVSQSKLYPKCLCLFRKVSTADTQYMCGVSMLTV